MIPVPEELETVRHILTQRQAGAAFRVITDEPSVTGSRTK